MNLHGLRLFYTAVKMGSITKAAKSLHISQPAVSSQLSKFEDELGLQLFEKEGRGVRPTAIGRELAEKAENLFAVEASIEKDLIEIKQGRKGKIRIAATYLPANYLLPKWVAEFKKEYANVELEIITTNSTGAAELVEKYQADIAIYGGSTDNQSTTINWTELAEDDLWFVVSSKHPLANKQVSLESLMNEPFVMREEGSSTRARLLALCKSHGVKAPNVGLQYSGLHEVIQSVMQGYGANFISSLAVREHVENKKLARVFVEGIGMKNKIAIGIRKDKKVSNVVDNFIKNCFSQTKED